MIVPRTLVCTRGPKTAAFLLVFGALGASACGGEPLDAPGETDLVATEQAAVGSSREIPDDARFFTPPPNPGAVEQIAGLVRERRLRDALRVTALTATPHAAWFTGGTPSEVERAVRRTVTAAQTLHRVPVLVAYDIPFRDCQGFSAGGATNGEEYAAWIDGFARGIGNRPAVVMLEPDGLGIIPHYVTINGVLEDCQPDEADPATAAADRFAQLGAAVDRLLEQPNTSVYLDGTHSHWLGTGDASDRLVRAGVQRAQGFFVNVSNYQSTEQVQKYAGWISKCIAFANNAEEGGWRLGHYDWCASQYYPANVDDFSTWAASDAWYAQSLGTAVPVTHYVVDTSRNGQGAWRPDPDAGYPNAQDWCNPPGRGAGLRPTARTSDALLDAYLWIKVPGESDGSCNRGLPAGTDPEWGGIVDPAAGLWFPEQALELATLANPPLL